MRGLTPKIALRRLRIGNPPRTCGGEPYAADLPPARGRSAPHMRGGTHHEKHPQGTQKIRPAHAGMNLNPKKSVACILHPPRTCGGEPSVKTLIRAVGRSAPHMRG